MTFFFVVTMLNILQKITSVKVHIFRTYINIHSPVLIGPSVAPSSQVRVSAILLLLIVGSQKQLGLGSLQLHNVHTECNENVSLGGAKLKGGHTGTALPLPHVIKYLSVALIFVCV
jgi:hypothetical protein